MIEQRHIQFKEIVVTMRHQVIRAEVLATVEGMTRCLQSDDELTRLKKELAEKLRRLVYWELEQKIYDRRREILSGLFGLGCIDHLHKDQVIKEFERFCQDLLDMIQWKKD